MNQTQFRQARQEFEQRPIPELIEFLASEDLKTRFLAEMALRDATST